MNIFHGIRKGKKEGRWIGGCPRGYKNTRNEFNRPVITPEGGLQEKLVVLAFKEFSTGKYSIEALRTKLNSQGLFCTKNSFWMLLRNKVYIGKTFVPAYKDEPPRWVQAIHKPLISESTFYKVQEILEGRKKHLPCSIKTLRDEFPLRGILICPRCGKLLTASWSRGRMGTRYPYYHCNNVCKERKNSELVNTTFENLLERIKPTEDSVKLFTKIVSEKLKEKNQNEREDVSKIESEIAKYRVRLENAKNLMLDGEIEASEYKEIKHSTEEKINQLSLKLNTNNEDLKNIISKIKEASSVLKNLSKAYQQSDTSLKRQIVSSIFPSGLIFEEKNSRTLHMNEVIVKIFRNTKGSQKIPQKKHTEFGVLSLGVNSEGVEPPTS